MKVLPVTIYVALHHRSAHDMEILSTISFQQRVWVLRNRRVFGGNKSVTYEIENLLALLV